MIDILSYVIDNFQLYYSFDRTDISYGIDNCKSKVNIVRNIDDSFFSEKNDINCGNIVWKEWNGEKIPFLFDDNDQELYTIEDGRAIIHFDIIAASFYFLSGWNEYVSEERDRCGRMPYNSSIIKKLGIHKIPVVNYYFDILYKCLYEVSEIQKNDLWGEKEFGVFLSHDIDQCMTGWRQSSKILFKERKLLGLISVLVHKVQGKDEFFNFRKIVQIEKQYQANSSFFFLRRVGDSGNILNADYNGASRKLKRERKVLLYHGNEMGIHGSYGSHGSKQILNDDMRFFDDLKIIANRFHYLKYDPLETVSVLAASGLKYDASIGFAEEVTFPRATCFPFYLFDLKSFTSTRVMEYPLNCMDVTFQEKKYLGRSPEDVLVYLKPFLDQTHKFGGVFTVLWHNNNFSSIANPGWDKAYMQILEYCKGLNAIQTSGEKILNRILEGGRN